jgi:hypothetical protein
MSTVCTVVNLNHQDRPFTPLAPPPASEPTEFYSVLRLSDVEAEPLKQRAGALTAREITHFNTLLQEGLAAKARAFEPRYQQLALRVKVEAVEKRLPRSLVAFGHTIMIAPYGAGYSTTRDDFLADTALSIEQITSGLVNGVERVEEVALAEALSAARKAGKVTTTPSMTLSQENLEKSLTKLRDQGIDADILIVSQAQSTLAESLAPYIKSVVTLDGLAAVHDKCITCRAPVVQDHGEPEVWYLAQSCRGDKFAFITATENGFEFLTNIAPSDPTVFFKNRFGFGVQQYAGAIVAEPSLVACFTP